ncbi:hypothetical protein [Amycolatopsis sp. cmx-11-32]|uniref:hypothetical protein n=1 Tax=Amycolatopsis sp. cmx-11-32 TaxID=2785796 RepID=UPI0039E3CB52
MSENLVAARRRCADVSLMLSGMVLALVATVENRWARVRASGDRGSESVEKAVLVAIGLVVAIGLGVAIRAAVTNYQSQIR